MNVYSCNSKKKYFGTQNTKCKFVMPKVFSF